MTLPVIAVALVVRCCCCRMLLLLLLLLSSFLPMPVAGCLRCWGYGFRRSLLPLLFMLLFGWPLWIALPCVGANLCEIAIRPTCPSPLRPEVERWAEIARDC